MLWSLLEIVLYCNLFYGKIFNDAVAKGPLLCFLGFWRSPPKLFFIVFILRVRYFVSLGFGIVSPSSLFIVFILRVRYFVSLGFGVVPQALFSLYLYEKY